MDEAVAIASISGDVESLLRLARDRSVEGRKRLVAIVSDLYFNKDGDLTARERSLMTDILRKLIQDVGSSVRRALAERLSGEPNAPHEIIVSLAHDEIEVAEPVLKRSAALEDMELIEVIRHRSCEHQLAIAMRRSLSEAVSDALVETGHCDVIKALLENANASISEATLAYLVDQSRTVDSFQEPILRRPDLSPLLARRMYLWVSAALRQHILENFHIDVTALDDAIEGAIGDALGRDAGDGRMPDRPMELARRLAEAGEITPQLLVNTLRQGEIPLFEALLCQLSGLRLVMVRRLLFEPGGESLAVLCRAIGIDKPTFASIYLLSRRARPSERSADPRELSSVLALFDRTDSGTAKAVVVRWRRDPDYLEAIRAFEQPKPLDWTRIKDAAGA